MRLLVVEDSKRLREGLADGLRAAGHAVDALADGRQGLIHARTTEYDLIILDLMLPELGGLDLLKELRRVGSRVPVLILSARDRVEHRVEGLRAGADDYLIKPFAFDELLARVESLTRRAHGLAANTVRVGSLTLDLAAKRFTSGADPIDLTPREFAILHLLVLNAGRTLSRVEIEEHVYESGREVWSNVVDSAIASIRKKLADAGVAGLIETRRGHGYLIPARAVGTPV